MNNMNSHGRSKPLTTPGATRRGFSLAEALVAVGTIVVLAGLLLPAVSRARSSARQAVCLAQVRQLGQAYTAYLIESDRQGFAFDFSPESSWVTVLRARMGVSDPLYRCPSAAEQADDFGTASSSWTLGLRPPSGPVTVTGGYGFNGWLLAWDEKGKGGDRFSGGTPADHIKALGGDPARVPVFADCTWLDAWPRASDPTPPNLTGGDRRRQGKRLAPHENMMARFTIARHGDGPAACVNACFLDGHAEAVPLSGLKRLQWSSRFVATDWNPPLPHK